MSQEVEAACAYEDLYVPALSSVWAPRLLERAQLQPGDHLLDVACGTGIVGRLAERVIGSKGKILGIDSDTGMITVARRKARHLEWKVGHAGALPEPDQSFNVVTCQFGLMFVSDPREALSEMARVLVPGGRVALAVWDLAEKQTGITAEINLVHRIAGPKAARALRAPFYLGNPHELLKLVEAIGFSDCALSTEAGVARFPNVSALVETDLRNWLPRMRIHLVEEQIERILQEAEYDLAPFIRPDGEVVFEMSAHLVTGTR